MVTLVCFNYGTPKEGSKKFKHGPKIYMTDSVTLTCKRLPQKEHYRNTEKRKDANDLYGTHQTASPYSPIHTRSNMAISLHRSGNRRGSQWESPPMGVLGQAIRLLGYRRHHGRKNARRYQLAIAQRTRDMAFRRRLEIRLSRCLERAPILASSCKRCIRDLFFAYSLGRPQKSRSRRKPLGSNAKTFRDRAAKPSGVESLRTVWLLGFAHWRYHSLQNRKQNNTLETASVSYRHYAQSSASIRGERSHVST